MKTLKNHPTNPARRAFMRKSAVAAALTVPMISLGRYQLFAASSQTYSAKAIDLVNRSLVIDMLSNLASFGHMMPAFYSKNAATEDAYALDETQLQKLLTSGVDVFHPALGIGGYEAALAFVARLNAYAGDYPDQIHRIDSVQDMDAVKTGEKIGFIVGIQNADHFRTPDDVNAFWHLGQRVSQLTYNTQNRIGSGSTDRVDGGISDFGVAIIERMNAVGMAIDVSHCGDQTTLDAFAISKKPVLITHSNARALTPGHPRCKTDEAIKAMARSGGVMGITGVRNFVRDKEPTTIEHLVDHIDHVVKRVGIDHVGIGSDMDPDGYDDIPKAARDRLRSGYKGSYGWREKMDADAFDHPKRVFDLTEALLGRGYSATDIELILGGNFRRVLAQVWQA